LKQKEYTESQILHVDCVGMVAIISGSRLLFD